MEAEETGPGRPEFEPTDKQKDWVTQAAEVGVPQEIIRLQVINPDSDLPVSLKTLRKHFRDQLDTGLANYAVALMTPAYAVATDKDHPDFARLNIWAQKSRLGMKETSVTEITGPDGEGLAIPQLLIIENGNKDPD